MNGFLKNSTWAIPQTFGASAKHPKNRAGETKQTQITWALLRGCTSPSLDKPQTPRRNRRPREAPLLAVGAVQLKAWSRRCGRPAKKLAEHFGRVFRAFGPQGSCFFRVSREQFCLGGKGVAKALKGKWLVSPARSQGGLEQLSGRVPEEKCHLRHILEGTLCLAFNHLSGPPPLHNSGCPRSASDFHWIKVPQGRFLYQGPQNQSNRVAPTTLEHGRDSGPKVKQKETHSKPVLEFRAHFRVGVFFLCLLLQVAQRQIRMERGQHLEPNFTDTSLVGAPTEQFSGCPVFFAPNWWSIGTNLRPKPSMRSKTDQKEI